MKSLSAIFALLLCAALNLSAADRPDGRQVNARAITHNLMAENPPRLKYHPGMNPAEFAAWQSDVAKTMSKLMNYPMVDSVPAPKLVGTWPREGYTLQRWEAFPLPGAVVPFLVLIPDGIDARNPAPAVLCIPGHGQTKELLAGESNVNPDSSTVMMNRNAQGLHFVAEGCIAVVVDNPACGESANGANDYVNFSRSLLELGWSYLGYTAYVDHAILNWMKSQPQMRSDRLIVSGFSLGTEPLMAIGVTDPDIFAFVYNDFLCTTRERALVMTQADQYGRYPWPNDISHLIPAFLTEFDFPDLVSALAPRPVICTEGGMDRDFNLVADAFSTAGAPDAFEPHHYAKYAADSARVQLDKMPAGIDRDTFFRLANVDPPNHYFKAEHIMPWLRKILAKPL